MLHGTRAPSTYSELELHVPLFHFAACETRFRYALDVVLILVSIIVLHTDAIVIVDLAIYVSALV